MGAIVTEWRAALANPAAVAGAREAYALFQSYCASDQPRIAGMGTLDRLAVRINRGAT